MGAALAIRDGSWISAQGLGRSCQVVRPRRAGPCLVNGPTDLDFPVIGAQRAGTTLLHQLLATHPEVYVPSQRKELHYFDRYFERATAGTRATSRMSMPIGAISPSGRSRRTTWPTRGRRPHPRHPALLPPDRHPARSRRSSLLVVPVQPAQWRRAAAVRALLDEDPTAVEYGLYHKHLSRYWQLVPRHLLQVLIYEDLVADPLRAARALASFLGLVRPFPDPSALVAERVNAGVAPATAPPSPSRAAWAAA